MSILQAKTIALRYRVFVSYSSRDMPLVDRVQAALVAAGATPFVAEQSIPFGDSISSGIAAALKECNLFVVLWSKNSSTSEWVAHELGQAKALGKRIVGFVLDEEAQVPSFLRDIKYIRAYENLEGNLTALAKYVETAFAAKKKDLEDQQSQALALLIGGIVLFTLLKSE